MGVSASVTPTALRFGGAAGALLLAACPTPQISAVREIGNGSYFVTVATVPEQGAARERVMRRASEEAEEFCGGLGKMARLRDATLSSKKDEDTIIAFDCK
jgi:hypothetical protein